MGTDKIHQESHPLSGLTVKIKDTVKPFLDAEYAGKDFRLEDWWDRLDQGSWKYARGNPACLIYALRAAMAGIPADDEVVYGKIGSLGYLIHVSEIDNAI